MSDIISPEILSKLKKLRPNRQSGQTSPHKIALLLAVAKLFDMGMIHENRILITPELIAHFHQIGHRLAPTYANKLLIHLPLYHLQSSRLWNLQTVHGISGALTKSNSPKSLSALLNYVEHIQLHEGFFQHLSTRASRTAIKKFLIQHYFPESIHSFKSLDAEVKRYLIQQEQQFLEGVATEPSSKMAYEVRSTLFKQQVPKVYEYTCSISGLKVEALNGSSLIDACHIQPFSVNHLDTVQNGICLTPTIHRAFDRGLLSISDNYRVLISKHFSEESQSPFSIRQFEQKSIQLPEARQYCPDKSLLAWHRTNHGFE